MQPDPPYPHVLGIHQSGPISSAALVADGIVAAGAAEERFSRIRQDNGFPHAAAAFCLDHAGLAPADLRVVAIGWNAGENAAMKYRAGFSDWMRYPGEWLSSVPNHLLPRIGLSPERSLGRFIDGQRQIDIHYVDHHTCHARLAVTSAGLKEAAVLVVDGWSEQKTTTMFHARNGELHRLQEESFPHSLGCLYAALTQFLGYRPFSDEWRVMGMAAYGDAAAFPQLQRLVHLGEDGRFELDLGFFDFFNFDRPSFFSRKLETLLGPARQPADQLEQRHYDLAASAQALFAQVMDHLLAHLHAVTGCADVCLTGAAAMNCLYNGVVVERTPFRACHVSFAPDDSGNAIGAALEVARDLGIPVQAAGLGAALGPAYDDDAIGAALDAYKLRYRRVAAIEDETARLLAAGKVVGWFQGRAEFGQRALGQRSILASPLHADMKAVLNRAVKFREAYRPFAPVVTDEAVSDYFERVEPHPVRFMEKALRFRPDSRARVPAAIHHDGTGRLQMVGAAQSPRLHRLLQAFARQAGHPVLINTSFNLNGEPLVNSPEDALRTYVTCGMDALVLGDFLLSKDE